MDYRLDLGVWNGVFVVPNVLTDRYLRSANESELKFILYLLRHPNQIFDEEIVCTETGINASDYKTAFDYWIEKGFIKIEGEKVIPEKEAVPTNETKVAEKKEEPKAEETVSEKTSESGELQSEKIGRMRRMAVNNQPSSLDPFYVSDRINADPKLLELVKAIESLLGGKMTAQFQALIVSCVDDYGMDEGCIMMLFNYCKTNGTASIYYLNRVVKDWANNGIHDYEGAEKRVNELENISSAWRKVCSICGIDKRNPTDKEKEFVNCWVNEWRMSEEFIREAYSRCAENKGRFIAAYLNKLLKSWHESGFNTVADLLASENKFRESRQKNAASYNVDELSSLTSYNYMTKENESALMEKYRALADEKK